VEGTLEACGRVVHRQEFVSVRTGQVDIIDVERMKEVHFRDTHDEEFNSRKLGSIKRLKAANPLELATFGISDARFTDPFISPLKLASDLATIVLAMLQSLLVIKKQVRSIFHPQIYRISPQLVFKGIGKSLRIV
jgi:hypothetical protein